MNTAATEIGDKRTPLSVLNPYDPDPVTMACRCHVCKPDWYARHDALDKLDVVVEAWSDALVDSENTYTVAGDDPLFDYLHMKLNKMQDAITDEINRESERIDRLRGE